MLYSFRFFLSWIVAAILMYAAFYTWHGLFLNDLNRITFSKTLFLVLAAFVYLIISFILYKIYESKFLSKHITQPLFKGVVGGAFIGLILFSFVTVLGISFTKNISIEYIIADFGWQITEQVIGGVVIGFGKLFIFEPHPDFIKDGK